RPVFVVGMPRSGSTLLEQILDSHPEVASIGETALLSQVAFGLGSEDQPYPDCLSSCTVESMQLAGSLYLAGLPAGYRRVVDKMLSNLVHAGLIAILFPNARMIHCVRHPLDTLLSCYSHDFTGKNLGFSYDFDDLTHYYRQYRRLMDHWSTIDALDTKIVHYEDVVGNTETAIRSTLDFLDLPWHESCVRFHENRTIRNTASYAQVRRPTYSDSVGRYKHYREQLKPLADALGDFLPESQ
ncbi:MAG: sulfotransferase, partial [Gammaproteobacteria bacterium]|nr:sulfotransferase [Gammaproteobacteria bacterium]